LREKEFFQNGKYEGEYVCFYKSGQIKEKGFFKNDKRHGDYIAYYKNGRIKEQAVYKNGNLTGKFLTFNEDGSQADKDGSDEDGSARTWDEKDVADLLHDLSHFDKKKK